MKISELKIGDEFRATPKGIVLILKQIQGMHNQVRWCRYKERTRQRNQAMRYKHRYFYSSDIEVYPVNLTP